MKTWGLLLLIVGFLVLFVGAISDISVASDIGRRTVNLSLMSFRETSIQIGGILAIVGAILFSGGSIVEALRSIVASPSSQVSGAQHPSPAENLRSGETVSARLQDVMSSELAQQLSRGVSLEASFAAGELTLIHGQHPIAVLDDAVADLVRRNGGTRSVQFVVALRPAAGDRVLAISITA